MIPAMPAAGWTLLAGKQRRGGVAAVAAQAAARFRCGCRTRSYFRGTRSRPSSGSTLGTLAHCLHHRLRLRRRRRLCWSVSLLHALACVHVHVHSYFDWLDEEGLIPSSFAPVRSLSFGSCVVSVSVSVCFVFCFCFASFALVCVCVCACACVRACAGRSLVRAVVAAAAAACV